MLHYFSTIIKFLIVLFCLIFIHISSTTANNAEKKIDNTVKIMLYYNSSNTINLTFLDTIWKQLLFKYNKYPQITFTHTDIFQNKYFENYAFESTPTIYIIINHLNLIYKFKGTLTFDNIEHFIMLTVANASIV